AAESVDLDARSKRCRRRVDAAQHGAADGRTLAVAGHHGGDAVGDGLRQKHLLQELEALAPLALKDLVPLLLRYALAFKLCGSLVVPGVVEVLRGRPDLVEERERGVHILLADLSADLGYSVGVLALDVLHAGLVRPLCRLDL